MMASIFIFSILFISTLGSLTQHRNSIYNTNEKSTDRVTIDDEQDDFAAIQEEHSRNCFFTPVQCMLPLTESHKNVQSLHGVYNPSSTHVRRSGDTMFTSPWGYTDLIKRNGKHHFYSWLARH